ncbi:hypothetical protein [Flavonifractor plautii]|jgi:hypothetical protein|uniref:glycine-rich domain-containing protein n=1 Tax=Flavonifractor plautii TaxID=292800 RepID=UPI003512B1F2
MATTEGYNGAYTGQQIDAAIGKINDAVTVPGGGTMQMGESLGDGPYTIEVTEDGEGGGLSAEQVGYSNTGSGLEATNVQEAIDELAGKGGGDYLPLTGGTLTGPLTLSGLPTSENHAANKRYVDTSVEQALGSIGYSLIKEYTSPGSYTHTFDRKYTDVFVIVIGAGGGGAVGSMGKTGQQSGRGNGGGGGGGGEVIVAHFLNSNIIKSNNIIIGYGGDGGMAVGPNGGNEIVSGNKGLNGGSTTAFGLVALGGEGAPNEQPGRPGGNLDSNRTDTPGRGGVSTQRGNDGILVDIIGIHMAGGGGGGADGNATTNKERGASGGATGGGDGGDGASQSANGTDGKNGSKGGGGGGAGGGCNYSSNQKRSGTGGRGGHGYVAIYGRG